MVYLFRNMSNHTPDMLKVLYIEKLKLLLKSMSTSIKMPLNVKSTAYLSSGPFGGQLCTGRKHGQSSHLQTIRARLVAKSKQSVSHIPSSYVRRHCLSFQLSNDQTLSFHAFVHSCMADAVDFMLIRIAITASIYRC